MNNDRIKELEDISNDFLRRLGEDEEELDLTKKSLKTEINQDKVNNSNTIKNLNIPDFSLTRLYRKQKEKKPSLVNIIINNKN